MENQLLKNILVKIKETRKEKGITQEEMGEFLGITKTGYNEIENGKRNLSLKRFLMITEKLEIKGLFDDKEDESNETSLEVIEDFPSFLKQFVEQKNDIQGIKEELKNMTMMMNKILEKMNDNGQQK